MEKLSVCRLCSAENVRMFRVVNRNLHDLYEKLTDIPFVTEDCRPILACFFCFAKLKQCYQLLRQCLEAEELFAQRMNEGYEPIPSINQDYLQLFSGFIKSPIEHISIVDECETESVAVKEEIPAICDGSDVILEPEEEYHSDGATVAEKPKLDTQRTKLEDAITAEQTKKEKSDSEVLRTTQKRTSKPGTYFEEPYECDHRNLNQVKKNVQRTRTQIGGKTKCDVCQRSFSRKGDLRNHIRIHNGEKSYKCDLCQHTCSRKSNLANHIRIHTGEKPYKCDVCEHTCSRKSSLTTHIRIHTGEKPYKCDICQHTFNHRSNLRTHIRIHTGEKPYKCDICQRSFSVKKHLANHIHIHTGEKPHKCDICQLSFSEKSSLTKHNRIHTDEKPYKCDVCQHTFNHRSGLRAHIRIHTGEKPHKCDMCQHSFSVKSSLTKHIRIHTGEKPYKCDICQGSFILKSNLTKHIRIHTSGYVSVEMSKTRRQISRNAKKKV